MGTVRRVIVEGQGVLPLDCPLRSDIHGDRSVMDYPFFALEKKPITGTIEHKVGPTTITVRAGQSGIATMYDKELILYVGSIIHERKIRGQEFSQEITFTVHDFFRATGTPNPGKGDYQRFSDAMTRLQGTQIQTNLKTGGAGHRGWFSWIENAEVYYDETEGFERLRAVRIRLCEFLFRAIERDITMLSYDHDYFKLGLIERRLYEIARSHCTEEEDYEINLELLIKTVGSRGQIRRFKQHLTEIEKEDSLIRYSISVRDVIENGRKRAKPNETIITFSQRPRSTPSYYQNPLALAN